MAYLVNIFLPLKDNEGKGVGPSSYSDLRQEFTERFSGVTAYMRAPAQGAFDAGQETKVDDIIVLQVLTDHLDRAWWSGLRRSLEQCFRQDEIVIHATPVQRL